jgi:hypothetical protein
VLDQAALGHELRPEHVGHALLVAGAAPLLDQLALVPDGEAHVGPGQRVAAHGFRRVGQLGRLALEELAPGRGAEEELAHLDAGARGPCGRLQLAAARVQPMGVGSFGRAADDGQLADRGDGGQRLAAKAHGRHAFQLGQRADLAGSVPPQGQRQLLGGDAAAVVFDHDRADAAGGELHRDLRGAGVQRVVDQLAYHRGRPLDHLARRDLAHQLVGQLADRAPCRAQGLGGQGCHRGIVGSGRWDNPGPWN